MNYIHITTDTNDEFVTASTTLLEGLINAAILERGRCVLGLSGGSTPKAVYEALGKSKKIDWSKVWIFLIDERHVPTDDNDSNTKLVNKTLITTAAIPTRQFKYPSYLSLEDWQAEYERTISDLLDEKWPDVVVLGMGGDGHIASLFPPISQEELGPNFTVHTTTDLFAVHDRISVTIPVLTNAYSKVFLLNGKEKKNIWNEMLSSDENEKRWPAKTILSTDGCTLISQW